MGRQPDKVHVGCPNKFLAQEYLNPWIRTGQPVRDEELAAEIDLIGRNLVVKNHGVEWQDPRATEKRAEVACVGLAADTWFHDIAAKVGKAIKGTAWEAGAVTTVNLAGCSEAFIWTGIVTPDPTDKVVGGREKNIAGRIPADKDVLRE